MDIKKYLSYASVSKDGGLSLAMDRRRFLQCALGAGTIAGLNRSAFGLMQRGAAAQSDSLLPDGTAFTSWEQPLTFSKTYYVDNQSAKADDKGPGSKERPFKTINQAAQVLQPGERVVIAAGTYRECVKPARGGSSPDKMISYEAAPGANVYIKGSEVVKEWTQNPPIPLGRPGATPPPPQAPTWGFQLKGSMFPDAYNPFALASVAGDRVWLDTKAVDMGPYFRRRGLVFADGKPLEPVELQRELVSPNLPGPPPPGAPPSMAGTPPRTRTEPMMQEIGGTKDDRFYTDANGQSIHIRLANGTPADHTIEITIREQVFVPVNRGTNYIRLKGISFAHAGNGFPLPQRGSMVDTNGGGRWVFEDNTFEWANAIALEIGVLAPAGSQQPNSAHVIRNNTFRYNGIEGVAGIGSRDVLIENNLFEWNCWADAEREWESAAAKFHRAQNMMFRRNVVRHTRHGNAIWLDSSDVNCRLTSNIFADTLTVGAAVHMEMNSQANQIDNNIIWDVRNGEPGTPGQRGCAGSGIFINASDRMVIAQNLIGKCDNSGIFAIVRPDRAGSGMASENKISNNIFSTMGRSGIVFLTEKNEADGNVYASLPNDFQGFFTGEQKQWFTLADWRSKYGWDKNSVVADVQISFDPDKLELSINSSQPLPKVSAIDRIDHDMLGKAAGSTRVAGPLVDPGSKRVWKVDPRIQKA